MRPYLIEGKEGKGGLVNDQRRSDLMLVKWGGQFPNYLDFFPTKKQMITD